MRKKSTVRNRDYDEFDPEDELMRQREAERRHDRAMWLSRT